MNKLRKYKRGRSITGLRTGTQTIKRQDAYGNVNNIENNAEVPIIHKPEEVLYREITDSNNSSDIGTYRGSGLLNEY